MKRFLSFTFAIAITVVASGISAYAMAADCAGKIAIRNPDGTTDICVLQGSDGAGTCVYDCV
jgi:hypothetical protein